MYGVCIVSSASVVGATVGIASGSFTLIFSLTTRIIKKLLSITRKKKHDKILMLAKSKLNSIETLVSQALIDMEISHEEFNAIIREWQKYEDERKCEETGKYEIEWCKFKKNNEFVNNLCSILLAVYF